MENKETSNANIGVTKKLLDILVCPLCKAKLKNERSDDANFLICNSCKLKFPIVDGIPQLLEDQAEKF